MDAITSPTGEFANRNQGRAVPFLDLNPAPIAIGAEVSVMILCSDLVTPRG